MVSCIKNSLWDEKEYVDEHLIFEKGRNTSPKFQKKPLFVLLGTVCMHAVC